MGDNGDEPTVVKGKAVPPTKAVKPITDTALDLPATIQSGAHQRPPVAMPPPPQQPPRAPQNTGEFTQDIDIEAIKDPKRKYAAIGGAVLALLTGGGVTLESGFISIGKPSDQREMMGPCQQEHCPTALEMQSVKDRLAKEQEFRQKLSSRLEDVEKRINLLIEKEQATSETMGTVSRSLLTLKEVAQNLNVDAMNRNKMSTDKIMHALDKLEKEVEEIAEDVVYVKKKVKRR